MNVIIVGCGRVGAELAYRLFTNGHRVCVIDRSQEAFKDLPPDFRGRTLEAVSYTHLTLPTSDLV